MMGHHDDSQDRLFYSFDLEEHVPQDHLLRHIDRCLDLSEFRDHMADYYSHTGRPSIDPELMIRMLIVGYSLGNWSERRLCEEVHLNLSYRWFCRLSLEDSVPNHSTFSKNRHGRFRQSDALRNHAATTLLKKVLPDLAFYLAKGKLPPRPKAQAGQKPRVDSFGDGNYSWGIVTLSEPMA